MASNDTQSSQAVARRELVNFMAELDELKQQAHEKELKYQQIYSEHLSRVTRPGRWFHQGEETNAGDVTLFDQKMLEKKEAVFGASLAKLNKRDWLEEVQKKKKAAR